MKKTKALLILLVMCILSMVVTVCSAEDTVIYKQNFDSYTGGRFEKLNNPAGDGSWTVMSDDKYLKQGTDGDNSYMYLTNDDDNQRLYMTYKLNETINSGMVVFTYDVAHSGKTANTVFFRIYDGSSSEQLILFMNASADYKKLSGAKPDFKSNNSLSAPNVKYTDIVPGKPVKVMQVLNFDDDYFETYIDGVFLERISGLPFEGVSAWGMIGYNTVNYFDNFSIVVPDELKYSAEITGEKGGEGVKINLYQSVSESVLSSMTVNDVTVTDKNGKNIGIKSISVTENGIEALFANELEYDEKYTVNICCNCKQACSS